MSAAAVAIGVRAAAAGDAAAVASLIGQLGYPVNDNDVRRRIDSLVYDGVWVAVVGSHVVGLATTEIFPMFHSGGLRARLTALVVDEHARGQGVGTALLHYVEALAAEIGAEHGCDVDIEVTSSDEHRLAHDFYRAHGYAEKPRRFLKHLTISA